MEKQYSYLLKLVMFLTMLVAVAVESVNITEIAEYRLYRDIFGDYNPLLRPRSNCVAPVDVELEYELNTVVGVDEVNEIMSTVGFVVADEVSETVNTVGFIIAIWYDEFLKWDPAQYEEMKHLVIPADSVWLPDIGIKNSATQFTDKSYREDFRVDIMYDGRIIWKFGGKFSTYCTLDMTYYPFDLQKCDIDVENWSYTSDTVNLQNLSGDVHLQEFKENGGWSLDHTSASLHTYTEDTHPGKFYPRVRFSIYIARKFQYYIINIILPALFVISISLMVFWLPPDSGEKVSLGVTVLLSFSVFQLVIMEHTPRTSDYTPVMNTLFTIIMGEATFSVLISICVLYYHHHGPESRPPKLLRFISFKILAKFFCMSTQMPLDNQINPDSSKDMQNDVQFFEKVNGPIINDLDTSVNVKRILDEKPMSEANDTDFLRDILWHVKRLNKRFNEKEKSEDIMHEWKCVARVVERTFFWFSFIITVIVIPVLLFSRDSTH